MIGISLTDRQQPVNVITSLHAQTDIRIDIEPI